MAASRWFFYQRKGEAVRDARHVSETAGDVTKFAEVSGRDRETREDRGEGPGRGAARRVTGVVTELGGGGGATRHRGS